MSFIVILNQRQRHVMTASKLYVIVHLSLTALFRTCYWCLRQRASWRSLILAIVASSTRTVSQGNHLLLINNVASDYILFTTLGPLYWLQPTIWLSMLNPSMQIGMPAHNTITSSSSSITHHTPYQTVPSLLSGYHEQLCCKLASWFARILTYA